MCMKYVNANTTCYLSVDTENNKTLSLNIPFVGMYGEKTSIDGDTRYKLNRFFICLNLTFLGTQDDERINESVLSSRDTVEIVLRLTKLSENPQYRDFIDLEKFTLDFNELANTGQLSLACFEYYNINKIIKVDQLAVPSLGRYVIKTIIRRKSDNSETVQNVSSFVVSE